MILKMFSLKCLHFVLKKLSFSFLATFKLLPNLFLHFQMSHVGGRGRQLSWLLISPKQSVRKLWKIDHFPGNWLITKSSLMPNQPAPPAVWRWVPIRGNQMHIDGGDGFVFPSSIREARGSQTPCVTPPKWPHLVVFRLNGHFCLEWFKDFRIGSTVGRTV